MSTTVIVPYPDYSVPVPRPQETIFSVSAVSGFLKINATDYLLINSSGDKLEIRPSAVGSPGIPVPFADYTVPVPRPEWADG
jgi:hypothetical protein